MNDPNTTQPSPDWRDQRRAEARLAEIRTAACGAVLPSAG